MIRSRWTHLVGVVAAGLAAAALLLGILGLASAEPLPAGGPALSHPAGVSAAAESLALSIGLAPELACQAQLQAAGQVCNGGLVTYTVYVTNSGTTALTGIEVRNSLPADELQKLALQDERPDGDYKCFSSGGEACTTAPLTQSVQSPLGDDLVLTVTSRLVWNIASLPAGAARTLRFTGTVVGQSDGATITDKVSASSAQGASAVQSLDSTVRVIPTLSGAASLADSPNWFSDDLGGTFSQDWGDFDRSGSLSLALGASNGVSVYRYKNNRLERVNVDKALNPLTNKPAPAYGVRWADVVPGNGRLELVSVGTTEVVSTVVTVGTSGTLTVTTAVIAPPTNYIYDYQPGLNTFTVTKSFTSEAQLVRVVAADFDGVNGVDLVASTNSISARCPVMLFKNDGAGNFRPNNTVCLSNAATAALAAADIDNDNDPDLVLGQFPSSVLVLKNAGGTLLTTNALTVEASVAFLPYDFAFGDYNRDGFLDLAAAYPLQKEARVYQNVNGGGFAVLTDSIRAEAFLNPLSVDWGDFDGNGQLDLAVADAAPKVYLNQNAAFSLTQPLTVSAVTGQNQLWSLRAVQPYTASDLLLSLTNRDGPSMLYSGFTPRLATALTRLSQSPAASVAWGATSANINRLDVVFGSGAITAPTEIYVNQGNGTFLPGLQFFNEDSPVHVSFGDVNGDGKLELARGTKVENEVCQFQGTTRLGCWTTSAPSFANHLLAWGDAKAEGPVDLLVGTRGGPLLVFPNQGSQLAATPSFSISPGGNVMGLAWATWDNSRYPGFAVALETGLQVYQSNMDGSFSLAWSAPLTNVTGLAWANFNHNPGGYPSLAVSTNGAGLFIFENVPDPNNGSRRTFVQTWTSTEKTPASSLAWGDWNNDSYPELAVGSQGQPVQVYANLGSTPGSPRLAWVWSSSEAYAVTGLTWGDADGDGYPELAVSQDGNGWNGYYQNTMVLPAHLSIVYTPTLTLPHNPLYVTVAQPGKTGSDGPFSTSEILARPGLTSTLAMTYNVFSADGDRAGGGLATTTVATTTFEYSLDGGANWRTATPATGFTPTVPTTATRAGTTGRFFWDALKDQAISDDARFRVVVVPAAATGPVQEAAAIGLSPSFRIRAVSCYWPQDVAIDASTTSPAVTATVFLTGSVGAGSGALTFSWNFGDGATATGQWTRHVFNQDGLFQVTLTVTGQAQPSNTCSVNRPAAASRVITSGLGAVKRIYLPMVARAQTSTTAASIPVRLPSTAAGGQRAVNVPEQPQASPAGVMILPAGTTITGTVCESGLTYPGTGILTATNTLGAISNEPALNEDGQRIAFSSTADPCLGLNKDGNIEIFHAQANPDGKLRYTQVTSSAGSVLGGFNLGPSLSAEGTRVAFFSDRNLIGAGGQNPSNSFQVFVADVDSTINNSVQLWQMTTGVFSNSVNLLPALSADGDIVAFVSDAKLASNPKGLAQIFRADISQLRVGGPVTVTQVTSVTTAGSLDQPVINADGSRIAFLLNRDIYVWDRDQDRVSRVTTGAVNISGIALGRGSETGSSRLAYISGPAGNRIVAYVDVLSPTLAPSATVPITVTALPLSDRPGLSAAGDRISYGVFGATPDQQFVVVNDVTISAVITRPVSDPTAGTLVDLSRDGSRLGLVAGRQIYAVDFPFVDSLRVTQGVLPAAPFVDQTVVYTMAIHNSGPSPARNVVLTTTLEGAGTTGPFGLSAQVDGGLAGFSGVMTDTAVVSGSLALTGTTAGEYMSRVYSESFPVQWQSLAWAPTRPLHKPLPNHGGRETGYSIGNVAMFGNTLLLHLDDPPGGVFADASRPASPNAASCFVFYPYYDYCPLTGVPGRFSQALSFNGGLRYLFLPYGSLFSNSQTSPGTTGSNNPFSVEMWFATSHEGVLLGYYSGFDYVPAIYVGTDGRLRAGFQFGCPYATSCPPAANGGPPAPIESAALVNDGAWHHVAVAVTNTLPLLVQDPADVGPRPVSGSVAGLYLDGQFIGQVAGLIVGDFQGKSDTFLGVTGYTPQPWPFLPIGSYGLPTFTGLLDEVAIYTRTLAADEIAARYQRGALRLNFQVRSCAQADCSDGVFVGPTGPASFYSEESNPLPVAQAVTLTNLAINPYFQYRAFLASDPGLAASTPITMVTAVTVTPATPGNGVSSNLGTCGNPTMAVISGTTDLTRTVVVCNFDAVPPGSSASVLLGVQPLQWGPFTNTVTISRPVDLIDRTALLSPAQYTANYTNTRTISVQARPITTVTVSGPSPPVPIAYQPATFTAFVFPNGPTPPPASPQFRYEWTWQAGSPDTIPPAPVVAVTNALSHTTAFTPTNGDIFTLTVAVSNGSAPVITTTTFTVSNPAPGSAISLSPSSVVSDSSDLTLVVTGTNFVPSSRVDWDGNLLNRTGDRQSTITLTVTVPVSLLTPGVHTVSVVNPGNFGGGGASNPATFTVLPPAPLITNQPLTQTVRSGEVATLTVAAAVPAGVLSYQWYQGSPGVTTTPVGSNSAIFTNALTSDAAYWVRITNTLNAVTNTTDSQAASILVVPAPAINNVAVNPASQTVPSGQAATITVTATASPGTLSYQWYRGLSGDFSNPIGGATAPAHNTGALTSDTPFWAQVINTRNTVTNTTNTSTITITVVPSPAITGPVVQPANATIRSGEVATLTVTATVPVGALSYQWYQGSSGVTTTPVGTNAATFVTPPLTGSTTYWVRVTNTLNGVTNPADSAGAAIAVVSAPALTGPLDQTIPSGDSATLIVTATVPSGSLSYQWYRGNAGDTSTPVGTNSASFVTPSLVIDTTYWVRVTNTINGVTNTTDSADATVTIVPAPTINNLTVDPPGGTITGGQTVTMTVSATASPGVLSYQWYRGLSGDVSGPIAGATAATLITNTVTITTSFWVRVTNTLNAVGNSVDSGTLTINVPTASTRATLILAQLPPSWPPPEQDRLAATRARLSRRTAVRRGYDGREMADPWRATTT